MSMMFFYFLKIIFDISTLKRFKTVQNVQAILNFKKTKKKLIFLKITCPKKCHVDLPLSLYPSMDF
jgi:hypothetical protein